MRFISLAGAFNKMMNVDNTHTQTYLATHISSYDGYAYIVLYVIWWSQIDVMNKQCCVMYNYAY